MEFWKSSGGGRLYVTTVDKEKREGVKKSEKKMRTSFMEIP